MAEKVTKNEIPNPSHPYKPVTTTSAVYGLVLPVSPYKHFPPACRATFTTSLLYDDCKSSLYIVRHCNVMLAAFFSCVENSNFDSRWQLRLNECQ